MSKFFKQTYNEQFKIYIKKSTWVMYILIAALIIGLAFIELTYGEGDQSSAGDDWRTELEQQNEQLIEDNEQAAEDEGQNEFIIEMNNDQLAENTYRLENDAPPRGYSALDFVNDNAFLSSLISLLTIIIAAGIVSNEFKWGTIKLLLIRPISRAKILLSKYVAVLLFALYTLIFVWFLSLITGMIFFGFEGFDSTIVTARASGYEEVTLFTEALKTYGYSLVNLVMMATFAFMISTIFRQSSLAIGLAIFLMLSGNMIVGFFAEQSWAKYILFANTNLQQFETGNMLLEGLTLPFSLTVLLVYYLVFVTLAWLFFTKRDVAGQ
ncbi:ABC transporter permease [Halalkalibacillus halophilus]|uniref:ABC transporter permease n=1 Tax=Halalkalibacillus halophilus TaxID=392827 RepID=UPI000419B416|nr:ABC transporter permease [Halalkalibacillus halophilus]